MSRGGSYGGGQSSLGYLFGSDEQKPSPPASRPVNPPPYGVDITPVTAEKSPDSPSSDKDKVSNNYNRSKGQNLGNFITDRPSTKVKSVPGGDSSLGYLFGEEYLEKGK